MRVVDFSFARPSLAQIKAAGADGVVRYTSSDPSKAISVPEASVLHGADVPYGLVHENGAADFTGGANAGVAEAKIAAPILRQMTAAELWAPGRPVYAAVDENLPRALYQVTWEGIHSFAQSLERPDACYGPVPFLDWLEQTHGVQYLWATGAAEWNGDAPSPLNLRLRQLVGGPLSAEVDWDLVLHPDWGQYPAPVVSPLSYAQSQVGLTSAGPYWSVIWPHRPADAVDWCACFVSACFARAGRPLPKMHETAITSGFVYCPDAMTWAKANGWWTTTPKQGDIVLYCWDGSGTPEHTGIVESVLAGGSIVAVEGNTGSPVGVYRETRATSVIVGFLRPFPPKPRPIPTMEDEMFVTHHSNGAEFLVQGSRRMPVTAQHAPAVASLGYPVKALPDQTIDLFVEVPWGTF